MIKDGIFGAVSSLLLFALLVVALIFNYVKDKNLILLELKNERDSVLILSKESFRELQNVVEQDLTLLVNSYANHLDAPKSLALLFQELLNARENLYLQARVIDQDGMEEIRVDHKGPEIIIAKPSDLQNKSSRTYFVEALATPKGNTYWSNIDLNIEQGVIQTPFVTTTRAAKIITNKQGERIGIVILNLDLNNLYKKVNEFVESRDLEFMHTDNQGYYLYHRNDELRWGNVLPDREHATITENIGRKLLPSLATTQTIKDKSGSILSMQHSPQDGLYSGFIAVSTPAKRVNSAISDLQYHYLIYFLLISIFSTAILFIAIRYQKIKGQHQQQIIHSLSEAKKGAEFKSRFLANMSHEIRTPLNAIVGMLFLIKNDSPTESQLKLINTLESSCGHLLSIVNDILDYSKIDSNMLKLEKEDFHLHEILDNVAGMSRQLSKDKDIQVLTSISDDVISELSGDAFRLTQILINLISNAIKFTSEGRVTLDIATAEQDDVVLAKFTVTDTGCGMSEETIELIRNPFQQADTSTTRRFGGTGLGISIVDQLTKLMGGSISINSKINEGSTFIVELPFSRSKTKVQYRAYDEIDFKKLNVLVVDDDTVAREYLSSILNSFGCQVTSFATGEDSLSFYQQSIIAGKKIHLIFMDWRLPGKDGLSIAKKITELSSDKKPVIIMETAYGREVMREAGFSDSINKLLVKPITPSDVFDVINEQLSLIKNKDIKQSIAQSPTEFDADTLKGMHVLVVDDNRINQTVCGKILSKLGATFEVADNGAEAIELLELNHDTFNVVLMDMQMPVLDGVEATKILRTIPIFKDLPIIALTANVGKEDIDICLNAGMNDYASKPIEANKLAKLISQHSTAITKN
ncbi:hybrid sensor histidine kinase/response regulator [uncultured Psychrosphaera sp.]|uniref:hybrid sensor histidine kinase/response regulator n=1 Tax=uncultured Psychrosphaera sp. TaxID=1403522 RepID=UPI002631DC3F|nr:hybrid sensor histidine kinase/response regulator [uncultured Psychrosphaera sp.]